LETGSRFDIIFIDLAEIILSASAMIWNREFSQIASGTSLLAGTLPKRPPPLFILEFYDAFS
jgi:hypothetical protein